jgi:hypothetical protein
MEASLFLVPHCEESRLTNGIMSHTMKEYNLMDRPLLKTVSLYTKKYIARSCSVPVMGAHHQEFERISLLENLLSTPASLVEIQKEIYLQPSPVRCTALTGQYIEQNLHFLTI